jgi:hypothetical protein
MLLEACGHGGSAIHDGAVGLTLPDATIDEVEIVAEHNPPTDSDVDEEVFGKLNVLGALRAL